MGKLIAVWGSPGSGKTTFSVKLAEALNSRSKKSAGHKTLVVFTDLTSPVVPVVFPNRKSEDIYSLGSVLVKTDLSPNVIFSNTMFIKDRSDLGYLGYTAGENKFSYPALTEDKIRAFEEQLRLMADFVVGEDRLQSVRSYQYSFSLLLKKLGISHRGFHALRHTFATRALECGMDVKTLSEILGHKNPVVTLNHYAHSLMPHKHEAMNRLGKLF